MSDFYKKVNITELSRLTNKTRPSIYKYVEEYITGNYKDIPHSFVVLFNKINDNHAKDEIIKYCQSNFQKVTSNEQVNELILLLKKNYEKINLDQLEKIIKEQI
ncbi:MAG: hypothetical protein R3Y05_04625 [bacterium]